MANNKLAYLELPATDIAAMKSFYAGLFGWTYQDFGPEYAAFNEGLDGGFNATGGTDKPKAPLAVIQTDAIERMQDEVEAAGATISLPIFAYPGGRRFHFIDPSGNELAVMQPE